MLLNYFGEKNSSPCGHCDICERRNDPELTSEEFEMITEKLRLLLVESHLLLDEIIKALPFPEERSVRVFRWLQENGKIKKDKEFRFFWTN